MDQFLKRCFYHSDSNRLFYLSIPPNIFVDVVKCASLKASSRNGWTRVIVEKPFGRDSESSSELTRCLKQIDRYLGKELVENLSVLRFSNIVFEPLWCRNYIRNVQLIFLEDFGIEGRGGLDAEEIRNEKVKVLRSMRPIQLEDVVVGQYKGRTFHRQCKMGWSSFSHESWQGSPY
ncbi:hypothetical protein Ahy_A06g028023 [Arachis hypogaea]|uniref:Glucose-6-phosphate dehydrogenase (NADP(+)) n=1 Tax=Arachis hypogaea TaxID=3818 RepID=A0A445CQC5_ARAHY|nr:hypothetical protein Ahy_A06g028023 [Arachis hypogaea]